MSEKKLYKIVWSAKIFGESSVMATSKEEARKLAEQGKDEAFERLDTSYPDWNIEEIEEIEEPEPYDALGDSEKHGVKLLH